MQTKICLVILVSAIATQISRLTPMLISARLHISEKFEQWLKYIPVSVLTALIVPEFFVKDGNNLQMNTHFLIAAFAALTVGLWKKNMLLSTITGVLCVAILRALT